MHRRLLIAALGFWPAARVLAQGEPAKKPHHKVSANELRKAMAARFPVRFSVAGLLNVQVDVPDLRLLPARQRLGATARVRVEDLSTRQVHSGEMDLLFALRCEPADRTLRAHHLEVVGLHSPTLPPRAAQRWQELLASFTRGAVAEIVLHRFSSDELALADTLGFQPEQITVEDDGVVIWFAPRANG